MTEKAERGGIVSIAPFGYKVADGRLVVDAEKARIVSKIFADFLNNKDINMICDNLNSSEIRTAKGNLWDCRAVEYILQNPVYIGKIRWNPICKTGRDFYNDNLIISDGTHEPIVDEVIFEQTRQILFLQGIISKEHSHKQTEIRHLIQNLVKCSNCNSTLVPIKNNFLQCSAYIHGNCHSSHSVRIEKIEKVVIKAINILIKNNLINDAFSIKENYPLKTQNGLLSIIIKRIIFDRKASHLSIFLSQSK